MKTLWLYQILWGESTAPLAEKVNEAIKYGWEPQGGVCESEGLNGKVLCQAMVCYKDTAPITEGEKDQP